MKKKNNKSQRIDQLIKENEELKKQLNLRNMSSGDIDNSGSDITSVPINTANNVQINYNNCNNISNVNNVNNINITVTSINKMNIRDVSLLKLNPFEKSDMSFITDDDRMLHRIENLFKSSFKGHKFLAIVNILFFENVENRNVFIPYLKNTSVYSLNNEKKWDLTNHKDAIDFIMKFIMNVVLRKVIHISTDNDVIESIKKSIVDYRVGKTTKDVNNQIKDFLYNKRNIIKQHYIESINEANADYEMQQLLHI